MIALQSLRHAYPESARARPIDFSAWPEDWTWPTSWNNPVESLAHGTTRMNESRRTQPDPAVGAVLRDARKRRGLGLKSMAAEVGISWSYLGLLERGQRSPSAVVAELLVNALGLEGADAASVRAAGVPGVGRDWTMAQHGHGTTPTAETHDRGKDGMPTGLLASTNTRTPRKGR